MRIASFKDNDTTDDEPRPGLILDDAVISLAEAPGTQGGAGALDVLSLVRNFEGLRGALVGLAGGGAGPGARVARERVKLCAPIERPGKIICLAGNYREHITESGFVA